MRIKSHWRWVGKAVLTDMNGRARSVSEGPTHLGPCVARMRSAVADLGVLTPLSGFSELKPSCRVWEGCSHFHTLQVRSCFQVSNYSLLWTHSFIIFFFPSHFILEPEITHRPSSPGELSLFCLLDIQLKSWLFRQNAVIKVFYWKW